MNTQLQNNPRQAEFAALPRPDGGDRDEAVHRFMTVKEKGGRTCFVAMAEWYLAQLKGGASS